MKLTNEDEKELQKFTRFLAYKTSQIIIQSRLGLKIQTNSEAESPQHFFNLTIEDIPEVMHATKKVLSDHEITYETPLCVEISLRTNTGEKMILETWYLSLTPDKSDSLSRVTYIVYNRMGILLKSLLSITRLTPAYKLSRGQAPDAYVMCYRMYLGQPQKHYLGDSFKEIHIGRVSMPIGTIVLAVAYRTKMTITPSRESSIFLNNSQQNKLTSHDKIVIKNDHFTSNQLNNHLVSKTKKRCNIEEIQNSKASISAADTVVQKVKQAAFAFVDYDDNSYNNNNNNNNQWKNLWPSSSKDLQKHLLPKTNDNKNGQDNEIVLPLSNLCGKKLSEIKALNLSLATPISLTQNGSVTTTTNGNNSPISSRTHEQPIDEVDSVDGSFRNGRQSLTKSQSPSAKSSSCCSLNNNDFIVIDYQSSFMKRDTDAGNKKEELSNFYNDAQNRPSLKTFNECPALYDQVDNLADQLDNLECTIDELDPDLADLPSSLQTSSWPIFPIDCD